MEMFVLGVFLGDIFFFFLNRVYVLIWESYMVFLGFDIFSCVYMRVFYVCMYVYIFRMFMYVGVYVYSVYACICLCMSM